MEWVTGTSPIDIVEARKDEDPAAARERAVIAQLVETFGDGEFTAANAAAQIEPAIWREVMNFKGERPDGHGVGNWLRKRKDRTFSVQPEDECHTVPVALESGRPDRNGVVRWWFRGAGTAGTCGYTSTQPRESGSDISGVRNGNDPACTSSTRTSEPDGADAGIPFMITEAMKAALRARGWTEAGIRSLKPEQAHNILRGAA